MALIFYILYWAVFLRGRITEDRLRWNQAEDWWTVYVRQKATKTSEVENVETKSAAESKASNLQSSFGAACWATENGGKHGQVSENIQKYM